MGWVKAWVVGIIGLGLTPLAWGAVLFESAQRTVTHQTSGTTLNPGPAPQWLGARFALPQGGNVTSVGGEIMQIDSGSLFAAIVRLDGPTALPHGSPFTNEELAAEATFTAPKPSSLVDVPMAVSLPPGEYGLIFGSGMFGANAHGALTFEPGLPGVSYFDWYDSSGGTQPFWQQGGFSPGYFVVNGTVPEPAGMGFFAAVGALCVRRRGGRR